MAPWWVLGLAAVYVAYFCLLVSFEVRGPGRLRWKPDPASGAVVVADVPPGSAAARGGLRPGDRILAVSGRPVADVLDWVVAVAHFRSDRPLDLEVEREGRAAQARLDPLSPAERPGLDSRMVLFFVSLRLPSLMMALLLVWRRPGDRVALVGSWGLAALATATDVPREGMAAAWRALPSPVAALLWIPFLSGIVTGAIALTFAAVFPKPLVRRGWFFALLWAPALLGLAWLLPVLGRAAADGRTGPGDLAHVLRGAPLNVLYLLGIPTAFVVGYRRLTDANERRRVRVLVAGATVALLAPLPLAVMQWVAPSTARSGTLLAYASNLLVALFPLSFAYAVLRHRVFDLRLVVRAGVRYALARRTLLALVPLLAGLLVFDLLLHGDEPLLAVLARRGWVYAAVTALALFARRLQGRWLDALDRRLFRERYDAVRLLRAVVGDVEQAASPAEAGGRAVAAIESALHPELVALLIEEPGTGQLLAVAVAPPGRDVPPWPADSRLLGVLQALGAPLLVSSGQSAGVTEGLPAGEIERLEQAGVDLVVPVPFPGRRALLVLGEKRSAEPWDREERDLLATIALALGRLTRPEEREEMPEALPSSTLAGRYRLDHFLGMGGMGVVYEATDRQLERRVAVKLLREDRALRADAGGRFRREARALASFSHPNVVTVHDFGLTAEGRAFLVMEFLSGPTLRRLLETGPLALHRALEILRGIASAVEAAHARRIVHRDLKPENVILAQGETGEVPKVLDFGLARLLPGEARSESETATHGVAGTPRYMAPEQMAGGVVDPSWDLWALSVIAYEMLAGTHPFDGDVAGWRAALVAGRFAPTRVRGGEASRLDAVFARAFAPRPGDRHPSAGSLIADLRDALAPAKGPDRVARGERG